MVRTPFVSTGRPEGEHSVQRRKSAPACAGKTETTLATSSSVFFLEPTLYNSSRSAVTMKVAHQAGGVLLLAVDLASDAGYHLAVASYRRAPPSLNAFDVVATATAQPCFLAGNSYLRRIPT
jgi:hypothetical protein